MNKQGFIYTFLISFLFIHINFGQDKSASYTTLKTTSLFSSDSILAIKMSYSNKQLKKETNDSTYIKSTLSYKDKAMWHDLDLEIRARGKFRLKNCYFAPVKLSIKKKAAKGSLFEGNKKLKMVVPCLQQKDNSDNVIKEYVAYKMYEHLAPHHFKTRLVDLTLEESKGNKLKVHQLKAFLIEDDKNVAKRFDGKVYKRSIHPMNQEALASVRHVFFQYMIGNTDFSAAEQHNVKLFYIEEKMIPVPYDFDMSGLVNCSYAVVSDLGREKLHMTSVKDRRYRGFKRDEELIQYVRKEYLAKQQVLMQCLDNCKALFDNVKEFEIARQYIADFFKVLRDDREFRSEILDNLRVE